MRRLLNTLFILSEDLYLSLENENLVAWREKNVVQRIPLLNVENIFYFGYKGLLLHYWGPAPSGRSVSVS
jgi:CRISP-associated protein Cas1